MTPAHSLGKILTLISLAGFTAVPLLAQDASRVTGTSESAERQRKALESEPTKDDKTKKIPTLYEGETEDLGSQLLLLKAPPHKWFIALADIQNYYTSNAALTESPTTGTDVFVLTAQAGFESPGISLGGGSGKLTFTGGYRYQNFLYGCVSLTQNHDIAGGAGKIDSLDFQTHTPYISADWSDGGWSAGVTGRFSAFISTHGDRTTYQEWAPGAHAGYRFTLTDHDFLSLDSDFTYRISRTMLPDFAVPFLGRDLNDRADLGLSVTYTKIIGDNILLQPAYRLQYSQYTQGGSTAAPGAGRQDFQHTFSLTLGYYFNEHFSARLFASADLRDSDEPSVADYRNFNAGGGMMGVLRF
jgi:hypothetical protein